ncbi:hypothetical protein FQR65_LT11440 [Abscondita terminalis]|nr:hypothetical protein FQR65_LT11440 [Abscondita terminalis]
MLNQKCEILEVVDGLGYVECLSMVWKRKQLMEMFEALENLMLSPDVRPQRTNEIKLVKEHFIFTNKVGLASLCIVTIGLITATTFWILCKTTKYPFGLFVEVINMETTIIVQTISFYVIVMGYSLSELAVIMGMQDTETFEQDPVEWNYLKKQLKDVVTYHTAILDVAKLIEDAFNLCNLVKYISLSLVICLMMFGMSRIPITDGLFLTLSIYIILAFVPMQIVCYYGNEVIIQSQDIANCCYDAHFVGADIRLQKGLLLTIQRSQRPIKITVGKFAPLSLATSLAIMRAAYSYFMVLRELN